MIIKLFEAKKWENNRCLNDLSLDIALIIKESTMKGDYESTN